MKNYLKNKMGARLLAVVAFSIPMILSAQDGEPKLKLKIIETDSSKTCKAIVMIDDTIPVKGTDVNFYVKRFFGLIPIALAETTDENGEATVSYEKKLPGDSLGNIILIAQMDDDDAISDQVIAKWGTKAKYESKISQRELWASRSNAPLYLIIISNAIIVGIWGTMGYILYLLFFKMKKSGLDYKP